MAVTPGARALVRTREEGERRWFAGGGVHLWKATAEDTDGAFLLFEDRMGSGKVTPLHTHPSDETMVVLEGSIVVHLDGEEHQVGPGGVALAPRGVPHAFLVDHPDGARLLCLHTPGCCQAFYWDASDPVAEGTPDGAVDFDRVRASAAANGGIEILGPPPFAERAQQR